MRLIDADRLKDSIMFTCDLGGWIGETLLLIKKLAVKYIENAPTIDAVEVVRCRDCRYSHMTFSGSCKYCDNWNEDGEALYLDGDFFCAYGERREDGEA